MFAHCRLAGGAISLPWTGHNGSRLCTSTFHGDCRTIIISCVLSPLAALGTAYAHTVLPTILETHLPRRSKINSIQDALSYLGFS
jgi:hypothetical protein